MTDDLFVSNDNFSYVSGDGVLSYTKDFERIDGYGRGGIDTAQLFDTAGDDYYFSTADYTVLASGTRINKIKGFENTIATSDNRRQRHGKVRWIADRQRLLGQW